MLTARKGSKAAGRYDLVSVVAHEIGHALGYGHTKSGVMAAMLKPGERALPGGKVV